MRSVPVRREQCAVRIYTCRITFNLVGGSKQQARAICSMFPYHWCLACALQGLTLADNDV